MNIVLTIGIILSFFQFVLVLNKKNKDAADKILAFGMLIIGIHLLQFHLYHLGYMEKYPKFIGLTVPFPLMYGPIIFLYTQYSLGTKTTLDKKDYLHFLPAILAYLYLIDFIFFYSGEEKLMVIKNEVEDLRVFTQITVVAFIVSGLSYTVLANLKLINHKKLMENNFSYNLQVSLRWLKISIWSVGCVFLAIAIVVIVRDGFGIIFPFNANLIFFTIIVLLIFGIGFFGIQQHNIYSNSNGSIPEDMVHYPKGGEYKKSGLRQDTATDIHKKLLELMKKQKPYLNPKLTLINIAELLNISTNHLSQTINQYEKANFHDFINKYRVEEFISRAASNSHFSILANALDSGFNSKSSFNIVFKKFKHITPSEYMASQKKRADVLVF